MNLFPEGALLWIDFHSQKIELLKLTPTFWAFGGENLQLLGDKSANESIHSLADFIRYIKITIQSEVEDYSIMNAQSKGSIMLIIHL